MCHAVDINLFSSFLLSLFCFKGAIGDELRITSASDFSSFISNVNSGTPYSGTTVYLDSDLSLPEITEPVGKDNINYFLGIFNGQGHIISDLEISSSSSQYTGLFGYSEGLTIKNVVLDSSCSTTNSYSGSDEVYVGGIIGYCNTYYGQCNIENSVNMADVMFSGTISNYYYLNLGGLAGKLESYSYVVYVKNCANYGSVAHSGTSDYSYIGGIAGYLCGLYYENYYAHIQNSLNYGTITHSGSTTTYLYLGGITGVCFYTYIENCVSAGEISTQNTPSSSYIGSIVGRVGSYTHVNYCYYTSELGEYGLYEYAYSTSSISNVLSYDNITFELNGTVSVGSYTGNSLIDALNVAAGYFIFHDYSKWLLNKEEKAVKFNINGRTSPIAMDSQVILLPSLASEGSLLFDGWYNDNGHKNLLESFEINEDKTFYGKFEENTNNYTITFDTRREGVSVASIIAQYNSVVQLPSDSIRDYCDVAFWENEYGDNVGLSLAMPAHNFTLYAVWKCTHIERTDDFTSISKLVNSGTDDYIGTTIYLDSDLSLSGITVEPIGEAEGIFFNGVFDGQGYAISDFKMNSSLQIAGLFGYSGGLTIKNIVLDSSCSITNSYSGSEGVYVGGFIGYCNTYYGQCNIENSVNMAGVTFSGAAEYFLYLGGIAGYLFSSSSFGYPVYLKNCANYGSVTHSGVSSYPYIGGIVGGLSGSSYKYLYNCLNNGTITYNSTTPSGTLHLGGIASRSYFAYIENCVSAGEISMQNTPSDSCIGSVVGYVESYAYINYCYYTSDVGTSNLYGYGTPESTTETSDSPTTVGSELVSKLNSNATSCNWNKWLLNKDNKSVSFITNYGKGFAVKSQIILLPDLVDNSERTFGGWYEDVNLTNSFVSDRINSDTTLYGMFCGSGYAVTLDVNGGNELGDGNKINFECNGYYGTLPENLERDGYTFNGWSTNKNGDEKVESGAKITRLYNHTLYAHWTPKNYTVTFDATGGSVSTSSKNVTFDSAYGDLPEDATRDGYTFDGWFTMEEGGEKVNSTTTVTTSSNHILYAHWTENPVEPSSSSSLENPTSENPSSENQSSKAKSSSSELSKDWASALYPLIQIISLLI